MGPEETTLQDSQKRPDIFAYHDYRSFLREWFQYLRNTRPGFSLRALAREAKIGSGYLPMVLSGARNLSDKALNKMSSSLGLTSQEKVYLELLRTISDSESQEARLEALKRVQRFRGYQKANRKEIEVYRYLTSWFYVAIREMATLSEFRLDPKWIQDRLKGRIPLDDIKKAVQFLVENGYIEEREDGKVHLPEKDINCVGGVYRIAIGKFHREMLGLAADSISDTPSSQRNITGHTLAIASKDFEKVRKILDKALQDVAALEAESTDKNSVYNITLAAFPLTK